MSESNYIQLLKNIQQALSILSITDLNNALQKIITEQAPSNENTQRILAIVSSEFKITRKDLVNSRARKEFQDARIISYALLTYAVGLSVRKIAVVFNRKQHNSVAQGIKFFKNLDMKIKHHSQLSDIYKNCLKQYLELDNRTKKQD